MFTTTDILESGLEDEHGHICPACSTTFLCYNDCPEELPYKLCAECAEEDNDLDDDDFFDTCGHCGTELSEGYCSICVEMAD